MRDIEGFRIEIADQILDDLAARLARARIPVPAVLGGGESAETISRIEELLAYWRDGYDWRAAERRLNEFPHYRVTVDGVGIHFIHAQGSGQAPLPLLLTNGWPSSFVEYLGAIEALTAPGPTGEGAFSVVIATLPGYGFSDRCLDRPVSESSIARLFHRLMVEHLGYPRYVAHGDDIGGGVVNELGIHHPHAVRAIQTLSWLDPYIDAGTPPMTDAEQDYLAARAQRRQTEGAYSHVQATRPQTLAYGLNDSPVGLGAWILEKFLTWSDPATRGRLSAEDLLTTVMLYWTTETIGSSLRLYSSPYAPFGPDDVVRVPASVLVPNQPTLTPPPESWLRRAYSNLIRSVPLDEGGHFLALEAPERFVHEIREAFRPYHRHQT